MGDIVYGIVQNRAPNGLCAKILCTREPNFHFMGDLNAKVRVACPYIVTGLFANQFICFLLVLACLVFSSTCLAGQAFLSNAEMVAAGDRKVGGFLTNDYIMCEILELMPGSEKMVVGMRGIHRNPSVDGQIPFGLVTLDQFPKAYK